ncbi:succinate dehydrogenase/fumarate reductase iron-sulfur subunit [Rhodoblastus acidophilus]|nr:2Fe-2S iron-sulfur cluster-binding protein [Rhodoblastus acidophilus]PPQ36260.1 succinate dehydrogenase/fumarate reductase iron-sulfur subunit [Rhodoblastus acidophilus]RAI20418.1 hypothetical protein CH337_09915 [Rhodoblastus acidophilus]
MCSIKGATPHPSPEPASRETPVLPPWRLRIWRSEAAVMQAYEVPRAPNQTVLDLVTWVQRHLEPDLGYRYACRVGMCGSCAMMVNGAPRWTCRTLAETAAKAGALEIRPLRNLPVVKDLATDMAPFFDKWRRADGKFHGRAAQDFAAIAMDAPGRAEASAGIECIGCGVCYAACDTVAALPAYLGPAALNRAWTCLNDAREAAPRRHLAAIADQAVLCHGQENCSAHCPVGLDPAGGIFGLKRALLFGGNV